MNLKREVAWPMGVLEAEGASDRLGLQLDCGEDDEFTVFDGCPIVRETRMEAAWAYPYRRCGLLRGTC